MPQKMPGRWLKAHLVPKSKARPNQQLIILSKVGVHFK
jgi:hypothetical protein